MELLPSLTGDERKLLSQTITKAGTHSLRHKTTPETADVVCEGVDKYRQLSNRLAADMVHLLCEGSVAQLYPRTQKKHVTSIDRLTKKQDGLQTGYRLTGAVLAMTLHAYKNWKPADEQTVEELVDMQKNPITIQRNILMLAKKSNEINKLFEESLCLTDGATELAITYGDTPFKVITDETSGNYFLPDMIRVIQQQGVEVVAAPEIPDEQCPAQRFLPILWTTMVDICAEDTRYYATDLGNL